MKNKKTLPFIPSAGGEARSAGVGTPRYDPAAIEKKWQDIWEKEEIYKPDLDKAKNPFYNLMMFPYPSAEGLHVGSFFTYGGIDAYGRFMRMQGKDVFEPIGLDGFGIHSENYAIKVGRSPKEHAKISQENFYAQLKILGNSFDWSIKLETYDPGYYKWTQWLFIELFKAGLAYRKKAAVNFCPKDLTVLADEQVIDGCCERCGSQVEKKELEQWFFRITKYADRLLENIAALDWTEKVKIAQANWIGKKEGITIKYPVVNAQGIRVILSSSEGSSPEDSSAMPQNDNIFIEVFTTTPINFGATFLVLAPEHPIIKKITTAQQKNAVEKYIKETKEKTEIERLTEGKEKTGVFTGSYVVNHVTGKNIPIWIADYALINFGTGAVQGCPGHDQRDFEFAKKFGIPIPRVIEGPNGEAGPITQKAEQVHSGEKAGKMINSGFLNGMEFSQAMVKTMDYFEEKRWGKRVSTYHLRDWLISRQRYWGPPIPMVYCEKCEWQPVPQDQLPVLLPDLEDWKPTGAASPLASLTDWVNTTCPQCGGAAKRETDVSDTFLDSSWYFLRYLATERDDIPFPLKNFHPVVESSAKQDLRNDEMQNRLRFLPVSSYIGGAEHSVLHLLYARFITMVLHDLDFLDFEEPFAKFRVNGLIIKDGAKMSKSKGNVVVPDAYVAKYGADALRCYLAFLGPFTQGGDFSDSGIEGMYKFLKRVWFLFQDPVISDSPRHSRESGNLYQMDPRSQSGMTNDKGSLRAMHKTIKKVTEEIAELRFNTCIASLMEWYNFLSDKKKKDDTGVSREELETFLKLLAPFAPHITEELWQIFKIQESGFKNQEEGSHESYILNHKSFQSVHQQSWPVFANKYLVGSEVVIAVQINGKTRATIRIPTQDIAQKDQVITTATGEERVARYLQQGEVLKTIYVPGKIINFVLKTQ